ncbi:glycolate oxidase subunit GlcD [Sporosarcina sp. P21c]|uniref:FAD-binding oxidoreductase n=1 Tax=unclassified Sporosarcina TaxID=2647733 RepID=UPI000C167607|nr:MULTISPECIES: FAD-linked oxidase C-terminal domain-containing protein [unclassified Sporosarcina]PIC66189.1 glycolate oxidase subunit GlcD [Sporosarcina sp. P16a]PIC82832.1 glycolate oxidase subunit GlcD [Sporosarcina sp. P1]PIC88830.1 glycolate oxidase subunit GlcD [Sporosarcina sp. P21c]PIC91853.1 glycolate oxidase subunit GlcD [Sporosarcina sp. P25]
MNRLSTSELLNLIEQEIPRERILDSLANRYSYSFDASFGEYLPDIIVQATTKEEVSFLLKLANEHQFPVYPRGTATSLSGGSLAVHGGVMLDISQFEKKLIVDQENLLAIVSPSVITSEIHEAAESVGLFYPPDPSSSHVSTIGGNISENSSGPKGLKYGTTKEYVIGLEVVTPTGEIIRTGGKTVKNVTGYDLTRLIVGSEGTLGVITEAIIRLIPKPADRKTLLASFDSVINSGKAITNILASGILPSAMELMDNACIVAVENYMPSGLPTEAAAIIIIEVDGHKVAIQEEIDKCAEVCERFNATSVKVAKNEQERERIWKSRRMVSPAITQLGPTKISEDATVPRSKIPEMMERLGEIREKYKLNLVVFGHAGDGNLHPNILTDIRNVEEMKRVEDAVSEIFEAAIELGGTLSGEHGIGLLKAPYMSLELGENGLLMMEKIKEAWDPKNILNPGKIFPEEGQKKVVLI